MTVHRNIFFMFIVVFVTKRIRLRNRRTAPIKQDTNEVNRLFTNQTNEQIHNSEYACFP